MLYAVYVLLFVLYSGWFGQHIVSFYRTYGFRLLFWYRYRFTYIWPFKKNT